MILSLQTYSLRDFMPFEQMLIFCKNKGLSYVEPGGLYGFSPQEIVAKLKEHGLQAQSFHFGLDVFQQNWEELGKVLPSCGARDLVMPYADANSLAEVRELAASLQNIAQKLKGLGVQFHYHNHAHEITKIFEDKCFMDWLLELAPDLHWQVDVGWVTAGGAIVSERMHQWKERISLLHIKDILQKDSGDSVETKTQTIDGLEVVVNTTAQKGGQPSRIGDGIVDFEDIFGAAKELGISTFILENDNPEDVDSFADSGIALVQTLFKKYNG